MPAIVRTKEFVDKVREMVEEWGYPYSWVADELGHDPATVKEAYENGVYRNRRARNKAKRRKTA